MTSHRCPSCGMAVRTEGERFVPDLESVAGLPTVRRVVLRWAARRLAGLKRDPSTARQAGFFRAVEMLRYWAGTETRLAELVQHEETEVAA